MSELNGHTPTEVLEAADEHHEGADTDHDGDDHGGHDDHGESGLQRRDLSGAAEAVQRFVGGNAGERAVGAYNLVNRAINTVTGTDLPNAENAPRPPERKDKKGLLQKAGGLWRRVFGGGNKNVSAAVPEAPTPVAPAARMETPAQPAAAQPEAAGTNSSIRFTAEENAAGRAAFNARPDAFTIKPPEPKFEAVTTEKVAPLTQEENDAAKLAYQERAKAVNDAAAKPQFEAVTTHPPEPIKKDEEEAFRARQKAANEATNAPTADQLRARANADAIKTPAAKITAEEQAAFEAARSAANKPAAPEATSATPKAPEVAAPTPTPERANALSEEEKQIELMERRNKALAEQLRLQRELNAELEKTERLTKPKKPRTPRSSSGNSGNTN
jgi:hypothetical protein